ncbi:hypothetical protein EVAR_36057_1 [Eumeta japonica]|uniref:Uncharacterized protein n=1 Tax=Eumeta variegata TaxID=151549 RepID=A0A4C1WU52_EUMVA|nr:hypothetical protein EVAR_36057_1 [Eumeta japonica]
MLDECYSGGADYRNEQCDGMSTTDDLMWSLEQEGSESGSTDPLLTVTGSEGTSHVQLEINIWKFQWIRPNWKYRDNKRAGYSEAGFMARLGPAARPPKLCDVLHAYRLRRAISAPGGRARTMRCCCLRFHETTIV